MGNLRFFSPTPAAAPAIPTGMARALEMQMVFPEMRTVSLANQIKYRWAERER